jgi:hypothetical protein
MAHVSKYLVFICCHAPNKQCLFGAIHQINTKYLPMLVYIWCIDTDMYYKQTKYISESERRIEKDREIERMRERRTEKEKDSERE